MKSIVNAKKKNSRRYGQNLWGDANSPILKRNYAPGQHGQRRKKTTDYGEQLYAKQRLKVYYGNISEKQFHKYYVEAIRRKGDTAENLIGLLESRLDNLVYKAKFVPTVFAARQFVNHGHVTVNGKKVNVLVGVSGLIKIVGDIKLVNRLLKRAFNCYGDKEVCKLRRGVKITFYYQ